MLGQTKRVVLLSGMSEIGISKPANKRAATFAHTCSIPNVWSKRAAMVIAMRLVKYTTIDPRPTHSRNEDRGSLGASQTSPRMQEMTAGKLKRLNSVRSFQSNAAINAHTPAKHKRSAGSGHDKPCQAEALDASTAPAKKNMANHRYRSR